MYRDLREKAEEKGDSIEGRAEILLAKHRNGPTRDITVAFQGHYSRFVDMAPFAGNGIP